MDKKSLAGLKEAFEKWRSRKQHLREAVPAGLIERARKAAVWHGPAAVGRATKLGRDRLKVRGGGRRARGRAAVRVPVPAFSRVELAVPVPEATVRPFAEVETTTGAKLRLFAQTDQVLAFLSALCGMGGGR
jgi:hypothetical protein